MSRRSRARLIARELKHADAYLGMDADDGEGLDPDSADEFDAWADFAPTTQHQEPANARHGD